MKTNNVEKEKVVNAIESMFGSYTCMLSADKNGNNSNYGTCEANCFFDEDSECFILSEDWKLEKVVKVTKENCDLDVWAQEFDEKTRSELKNDLEDGELYIASFKSEDKGTMDIIIWNYDEQIYTYIYDGKKVFLSYEEEIDGKKPYAELGGMYAYSIEDYNGCKTELTYDDSYGCYSGEVNIVYEEVVNIENEQKINCDVVTEDWYNRDIAERMLDIETTRYYDWTSKYTNFKNDLYDEAKNGEILSKEEIEKRWVEICNEYKLGSQYIDNYRKILDYLDSIFGDYIYFDNTKRMLGFDSKGCDFDSEYTRIKEFLQDYVREGKKINKEEERKDWVELCNEYESGAEYYHMIDNILNEIKNEFGNDCFE